jgi:hypothetical protein
MKPAAEYGRKAIDQGILSPSGGVSKASREAALERTRVELFGEKGLQREPVAQPGDVERASAELKQLRDLKSRGMSVPGYRKRTAELEKVVNGGWSAPRTKLENQVQKGIREGLTKLPKGFRNG